MGEGFEKILRLYRNPLNFGPMENPDAIAEGHNPLCGDRIRINLRVSDGRVVEATFQGDSCAITTATASILTERARELDLAAVSELDVNDMLDALDGAVPRARYSCVKLPVTVLKDAAESAERRATSAE